MYIKPKCEEATVLVRVNCSKNPIFFSNLLKDGRNVSAWGKETSWPKQILLNNCQQRRSYVVSKRTKGQ